MYDIKRIEEENKPNEICNFSSKEIDEGCDVMRSARDVQGLQVPRASYQRL